MAICVSFVLLEKLSNSDGYFLGYTIFCHENIESPVSKLFYYLLNCPFLLVTLLHLMYYVLTTDFFIILHSYNYLQLDYVAVICTLLLYFIYVQKRLVFWFALPLALRSLG